jgi:hypothetical protein
MQKHENELLKTAITIIILFNDLNIPEASLRLSRLR